MLSIKVIFTEKGKKDIIIEQAKKDMTFVDLIGLYFKKACISKKEKLLKTFILLDTQKEIPNSSTQKLSDLGIKSLSKIEVKLDQMPKESYSLLEERKKQDYLKKEKEEIEFKNLINYQSKDKISQLKKYLLKREKELRNPKKLLNEKKEENAKTKNDELNQVLENMCIYGNILKNEIKEEKKKNPEKFIKKEEALKSEKNDQELFALALVADALNKNGIDTVIEKDDKLKDDDEEGLTCLQYISNGLNNKLKKYDLHFDFGEEKNNQILNNELDYNDFKEKLKLKISKEYNISVDKIIITLPQKGSVHVQLIFQSEEFNKLSLEDFKNKFNSDPEYKELNYLKEIHSDLLIGEFKLNKKDLDPEGNRSSGWGRNEKRGNKPYYPPLGWIGIGIKVLDKYDEGNNEWIGMDNSEGEWCVAYHGLCRYEPSDIVKQVTKKIAKGGEKGDTLRPGNSQAHEDCDDLNCQQHLGKYNAENKVGKGVYITPKIKIVINDDYAGVSTINGVDYYTALMVRVKPDAIRYCSCENSEYWVVNGTPDEIRPYRILYKKVDDEYNEEEEEEEYNSDDI